jgi:hypothetical protein
MANIDKIGKKSEELLSKNEPEYTDYKFLVRCTKSPDGVTKACSILNIETINSAEKVEVPAETAKTAEASIESPQTVPQIVEEATLKTVEDVTATLKTADSAHQETKPSEKDCLGCDEIQAMIETALKDQAASAAAAAASAAEKTVKVDAAAPRWLRRSPPEDRHRRMMKA